METDQPKSTSVTDPVATADPVATTEPPAEKPTTTEPLPTTTKPDPQTTLPPELETEQARRSADPNMRMLTVLQTTSVPEEPISAPEPTADPQQTQSAPRPKRTGAARPKGMPFKPPPKPSAAGSTLAATASAKAEIDLVPEKPQPSGPSSALIIGLSVAGAFLLMLIGLALFRCMRRRRRRKEANPIGVRSNRPLDPPKMSTQRPATTANAVRSVPAHAAPAQDARPSFQQPLAVPRTGTVTVMNPAYGVSATQEPNRSSPLLWHQQQQQMHLQQPMHPQMQPMPSVDPYGNPVYPNQPFQQQPMQPIHIQNPYQQQPRPQFQQSHHNNAQPQMHFQQQIYNYQQPNQMQPPATIPNSAYPFQYDAYAPMPPASNASVYSNHQQNTPQPYQLAPPTTITTTTAPAPIAPAAINSIRQEAQDHLNTLDRIYLSVLGAGRSIHATNPTENQSEPARAESDVAHTPTTTKNNADAPQAQAATTLPPPVETDAVSEPLETNELLSTYEYDSTDRPNYARAIDNDLYSVVSTNKSTNRRTNRMRTTTSKPSTSVSNPTITAIASSSNTTIDTSTTTSALDNVDLLDNQTVASPISDQSKNPVIDTH